MRLWYWLLGAFLVVLVALAFMPSADATTTCQGGSGPSVANTCLGYSHVSTTTGGTASARCFALRTVNTAPTCTTSGITPSNAASWEVVAGNCITFYYFDTTTGVVPPAAPNKVTIGVYVDNLLGTSVKVYVNQGAEPTSGTSYSFCATSDGTSTGALRAGTYHLLLRAIKDNGNGLPGNTNYDIFSYAAAAVGTSTSWDRGAVRGQMLVSSVARSAYPAGSTFAYGAAGDESVTITSTFTQPNGDNNVETVRNFVFDSATFGGAGEVAPTVDVDAVTTLAQSVVIDSTYPIASNPWVPGFNIQGNAGLTGLKWTVFAVTGHGANINRDSDTTVHDTTTFNIDPRIKLDSTASGGFASADETDRSFVGGTCSGAQVELFNRGETACTDWAVVNARDEYLSRAMTFARHDASHNVCASYGSLTPTSNVYTIAGSFSTGATCAAAADTTGSTRHLSVTNTDQSYESGTIYRLSSLYFVDSHLQLSSTLVPDDYPTDDANEILAYLIQGDGMGGDMSETIRQWCKVEGVRHDANIDTSGSALTRTIKDPTTATRLTATTDTGSDGWTPTSQNLLAITPLGTTWTALCSVAFNGNTGSDTETFTIAIPAGGGGDTFMADPLKVYVGPVLASVNNSVLVAVSASYLDGTARTGAAADLEIDVYDATPALVVTAANPTEVSDGVYRYEFTPTTPGNYLVLVRTTDPDTMEPIGTSNALRVDNMTLADQLSDFTSDPFGLNGDPLPVTFPGDRDGSPSLMFWVEFAVFVAMFAYFATRRPRPWYFCLGFMLPWALHLMAAPTTWAFGFTWCLPFLFIGGLAEFVNYRRNEKRANANLGAMT